MEVNEADQPYCFEKYNGRDSKCSVCNGFVADRCQEKAEGLID